MFMRKNVPSKTNFFLSSPLSQSIFKKVFNLPMPIVPKKALVYFDVGI